MTLRGQCGGYRLANDSIGANQCIRLQAKYDQAKRHYKCRDEHAQWSLLALNGRVPLNGWVWHAVVADFHNAKEDDRLDEAGKQKRDDKVPHARLRSALDKIPFAEETARWGHADQGSHRDDECSHRYWHLEKHASEALEL